MAEDLPIPARARLPIDDLTVEGDGIARWDGLVVFVPGALPGDVAEIAIERLHRRRASGRLVRLDVPAPARRVPPCPVQADCGGCPLMPLEEEAALAVKARHVRETLARVGGIEVELDETVASPDPLRYRGRLRFAVAPRSAGPTVGFRPRARPRELVPVRDCSLAPPDASRLAAAVIGALDAASPPGRPWPTEVSLRGSLATGEWLAVLHAPRGPWPEAGDAMTRLVEDEPALAGVVRCAPTAKGREAERRLAGRSSVHERIGGLEVELGASTFLQVNPRAAERLYGAVAVGLAPIAPRRVLDLFCGVGLAGLLGTPAETDLVGIEAHPAAVAAARRTAERAGRVHARWIAADALAGATALADAGERFDGLIANPPRAGAGPRLATLARRLGARRVVLVSCHPATLARDARALVAAGYRSVRAVVVDLFPQTPHVEAVLVLEERE
jgi:23S rRNA (uracil1939-C5)-methyltransferase